MVGAMGITETEVIASLSSAVSFCCTGSEGGVPGVGVAVGADGAAA
jgi:hypothetical protein